MTSTSRSSSTDSITSMVSLMAPINPSPLFSRREGEGGAKELRRSRSASICNLVTLGKPAPCPSTPSGLLDEDARSRAPSFCTVRRRSCSPLTLREESGRTPKRLPAHRMGSRLDVMEECPGEGSRRERSTEEGSSGESSGLGSSREGSSGEGSSGEGSSGEGSPGTRRGSNGYFSSGEQIEIECIVILRSGVCRYPSTSNCSRRMSSPSPQPASSSDHRSPFPAETSPHPVP